MNLPTETGDTVADQNDPFADSFGGLDPLPPLSSGARRPQPPDRGDRVHIHTVQAQKMFAGAVVGDGYESGGLLSFAVKAHEVEKQALALNPYAILRLTEVDEWIAEANESITDRRAFIDKTLAKAEALGLTINLDTGPDLRPKIWPVNFASEYAWVALDLVLRFDRLLRHALALKGKKRIGKDDLSNIIRDPRRCLLRIFESTKPVAVCKATLQDFLDETESARQEARKRGRGIPQDIASGEQWPAELQRPRAPQKPPASSTDPVTRD